MSGFCYSDGEKIRKNDEVVVAGERAVVLRILEKGSLVASDYSCFETGGILLDFENGDLQAWPFVNEDLILVRRCSGGNSVWS